MNEMRRFPTEKLALDRAREIEAAITERGSSSALTKNEAMVLVDYRLWVDRLQPFGKTVGDAVEFYIGHLGRELLRKIVPSIGELSDKWREFKFRDTTLSKQSQNEVKVYSKFIKWKWGKLKPDEVKKNEIDKVLKGLKITNSTRKKYLLMVRMFFNWVKDEGIILFNPTDGLSFKPEMLTKEFYKSEQVKGFLQKVVEMEPRLVGYYSLLIFAGLRPSEGARIQWPDINFETGELYVRQGKTMPRHVKLEAVAIEWLKWYKENTPSPTFIPTRNLFNIERKVREVTFGENWISDGFRHGFATYHKSKYQNIHLTADLMGNSVMMIKRHYAQTIPSGELTAYWALTPSVVLPPSEVKSPS